MHDGRFKTLEECIEHYNTGFHYAKNLDGALQHKVKGRLTVQDKADLLAFLKTLTDEEFVHNPKFGKP
jgi:cytochrome c peroxidase